MLCKKSVTVHCDIKLFWLPNKTHKYTLQENSDFLNVEARGAYNYNEFSRQRFREAHLRGVCWTDGKSIRHSRYARARQKITR